MNTQVEHANCPDLKRGEMKRKQTYLKDAIISAGFDGDEFAVFIESERKNGMDIENWTLEELETVVELFKIETDKKMEEIEAQESMRMQVEPLDPNADLDDLLLRRNDLKKKTRKLKSRKLLDDPNSYRLSMGYCIYRIMGRFGGYSALIAGEMGL